MNVSILVPSALRGFTGGASSIAVHAATAGDALDALVARHPGLTPHLRTPDGALRSFVNVYRNDLDLRELDGLATPLGEGDTLLLVPAIAGGRA